MVLGHSEKYGDNGDSDVQLYCLWAGWILLGSVPLTAIAQQVSVLLRLIGSHTWLTLQFVAVFIHITGEI